MKKLGKILIILIIIFIAFLIYTTKIKITDVTELVNERVIIKLFFKQLENKSGFWEELK